MIGLDMSFPDLYVDNNGDTPEFSKPYRHMEPDLAKEQKRLSRKEEGSKRYERQRVKVAKLHAKAKHQRRDFLHKLSSYLVKNYDLIGIEDLDMSALKKALKFGKSVSDNGWGMFVQMLEYKSEREGKYLIKIDRWFPSSKTCCKCGHVHKELTLSDRTYICLWPCNGERQTGGDQYPQRGSSDMERIVCRINKITIQNRSERRG